MSNETDVLVVGAGPTGLMAALCLAEQGIRCRIVDKTPARSDESRALVVHARTLELFQKLGFAGELVQRGRTAIDVRWHVGDRPPMHIDLGDVGVQDTPYPFMLFVSQVETESVMESALRARGIEVERPVELASFTQDEHGVEARLSGSRGEEVVRARYVVGADGAHSVVRKTLGLKFEGAPYEQNFVLADVEVEWPDSGNALRLFLAQDGMLVGFPMRGDSRYRILAAETKAPPPNAPDPTLEEVQALATRLGVSARLHDPHWLARFHLHHRGVDHYGVGRAFVAGDAAHIHSPAGGQGMNTGIEDSANLAWKLAMVVRGDASDRLLSSYEAERMPVGRRLLQFTDRLFSLAASSSHMVAGIRDFVLPHLVPHVIGKTERRAMVFRFISQLGIHYRKSPIVVSQDSGFSGGPRPGERAPDGPLPAVNGGPSTLFERLAGPAHHLLVFDGAEVEEPSGGRLRVVHVNSPELRKRYGVTMPSQYLVRPDGYVALRCTGTSRESVDSFFEQTYGAGQR